MVSKGVISDFFILFLVDRMEFGFYAEGSKHAVNGVSA